MSSHSLARVAIAGATGNLGSALIPALLDAGFPVTILTRKGSKSTASLRSHPNQAIKEVDYEAADDLTSALTGVDVVVATLAGPAVALQRPLIDAAVAAGVKRFVPSEFGCDTTNPRACKLPVYAGKVAIQQYLNEKVKTNPGLSYSAIFNNAFLDWGIKTGIVVNAKEHKATLFDGGDRPFSATRLSTIAKALVAIVRDLEASKNKNFYIHDGVVTQNQLISIVKDLDGMAWQTTVTNTAQLEETGYETLRKGGPDVGSAMRGFLFRAIWGEGYGGNFSDRLDNQALGIPTLSKDEIKDAIQQIVSE